MKLNRNVHRRHNRAGLAMVVVLALLAFIFLFVAANLRALHGLKRDLKIVEQQQIKRLNARAASAEASVHSNSVAKTNAVAPASESRSSVSE